MTKFYIIPLRHLWMFRLGNRLPLQYAVNTCYPLIDFPSLLKDVGTLEESHPYLFFLRMRLFAGRVRNNEVETAITEELAFMGKENIGGNDIYIQMEQTFITGYALCSEGKYEEADPYLETAYKLACQLPYEEGFKFRICTVWNFLSTLNFIDKGDLYIEYVEK